MLGDRAEQAAFMNGMEAARCACTQKVAVAHGLVGARGGGQCLAVGPFHLDRRNCKKQRTRKVALCAQTCFGDRLLGNQRRHALGELGRAERLDRNGVDRARDRGLKSLGREAADAANAGAAFHQLRPVLRLARSERRNDTHAGHNHSWTSVLVARGCHRVLRQFTASTRAMPSPRQCPTEVTTT